MSKQHIQPTLVSYHTPRWIRVAIRSYLACCPERPILVVDNNPGTHEKGWDPLVEEERRWLREHPAVHLVRNVGALDHGRAIDVALEWCRREGMEYLLHLEPDCLITGAGWYTALRDAVAGGADMAGTFRRPYGPIHVTPSIWRTSVEWPSFAIRAFGQDVKHPRFCELYDRNLRVQLALATNERHCRCDFARDYWDTAEFAWFSAALRNKAHLAHGGEVPGRRHYWRGCRERINHPELDTTLAELAAY